MLNPNFHLPSSVASFLLPHSDEYGLHLFVKRDDLIHPEISGNKYRKLLPNILHYRSQNFKGIITYGGAFSNHIYSTAAACYYYQIPCIGIIRGESEYAGNPTLAYAHKMGMKLMFVNRSDYALKEEAPSIKELISQYPDYMIIPEGGNNQYSLKGMDQLVEELVQMNCLPKYIVLAAGTGNSAAGILKAVVDRDLPITIIAVSALKAQFHGQEIIKIAGLDRSDKLVVCNDYHFGGYAKTTDILIQFINEFKRSTSIAIDPIYNGKVVYALNDLINQKFFTANSKIMWIHTGGLQGINGYNQVTKRLKIDV